MAMIYSSTFLPEEKSDLTLLAKAWFTLRLNPELPLFAKEIRALGGITLLAKLPVVLEIFFPLLLGCRRKNGKICF